ncbi:MAG: recombinase family protein, partial [Ruminococcus sp.]|nr:recombinase family protein [Ruminococcus sp.]
RAEIRANTGQQKTRLYLQKFARNTRDCLKNIRELKSLGITIFFEKEGIDTANVTDEMMITIMAVWHRRSRCPYRRISVGDLKRKCRMVLSSCRLLHTDTGWKIKSL